MADKKGNGTGALYLADLGYPMLPAGATEQEKFDELQDYLFRLVEALRWTMGHLDETNFNQNFFLDFAVGELYKPLPVENFSIQVERIDTNTVEAGDIGTMDGSVVTVYWLEGFGHQIHPHKPTPQLTLEATDGNLAEEKTLEGVEITTKHHDGPI